MSTNVPEIVRFVAEILEKNAHAKAVFGEAVKLDTCTIVPVAVVKADYGGGGGGLFRLGGGGGGGGGIRVVPIGFISEREGVATFTPIEVPQAVLDFLAKSDDDDDDDVSVKEKIRRKMRREP